MCKAKNDHLLEMEFCETPHILCTGYQTDLHAISQHGYPIEMGSDADTETEGGASPDQALRMWMTGMKSEHSSCLSSRANSALSLTDTDHERKSDGENVVEIRSDMKLVG
ncbi:UNVERIFIED_CONTAM: Teneurin-1 [Gekko kuhli]